MPLVQISMSKKCVLTLFPKIKFSQKLPNFQYVSDQEKTAQIQKTLQPDQFQYKYLRFTRGGG